MPIIILKGGKKRWGFPKSLVEFERDPVSVIMNSFLGSKSGLLVYTTLMPDFHMDFILMKVHS